MHAGGAAASAQPEQPDDAASTGYISLGLERAGFETAAFCEVDPHCREVLRKHWPDVPIFTDVRELCRRTGDNEPEDGDYVECSIHRGQDFGDCPCIGTDQFLDEIGGIDLIAGGFPCQDISNIGKREGIDGRRSGLWGEFARIIGELGPRYVLVENVAALLVRGLDRVLGDLATLGYDAEWHCIPAAYVGAPHRRDRLWIVAHARGEGLEGHTGYGEAIRQAVQDRSAWPQGVRGGEHPAQWWHAEPQLGRVANGLPGGLVKRHLTALGNSVVPQIPELIGRAILTSQAACG
jgi:DNA (cytosine-5)-methyltransferase 1